MRPVSRTARTARAGGRITIPIHPPVHVDHVEDSSPAARDLAFTRITKAARHDPVRPRAPPRLGWQRPGVSAGVPTGLSPGRHQAGLPARRVHSRVSLEHGQPGEGAAGERGAAGHQQR